MSNFQSNQRMFLMGQICQNNRHAQCYGGGVPSCCQQGQHVAQPVIIQTQTQAPIYYETSCSCHQHQQQNQPLSYEDMNALGSAISEFLRTTHSAMNGDPIEETTETEQAQAKEPTLAEQIEELSKKLSKQNTGKTSTSAGASSNSALAAEIDDLYKKLHPEEKTSTTSSSSKDDKTTTEKKAFENAMKDIDYSETKKAYLDAVSNNESEKVKDNKEKLNSTLKDIEANEKTIKNYLKAYGSEGDGTISVADEKKAKDTLKKLEQARKDIEETIKEETEREPVSSQEPENEPVSSTPASTSASTPASAGSSTSTTTTPTTSSNEPVAAEPTTSTPASTPVVETPVSEVVEPKTEISTEFYGPAEQPKTEEEKPMGILEAKAAAKKANEVLAETHNLEDQRTAIKAYNTWAKSILEGDASNWQLNDCITSMEVLCHPLNNDSIFVQDLITESKDLLEQLHQAQYNRYFRK